MLHRLWLARAIAAIHSAIVLLFAIGWALPWRESHWAVVCAAVIVQGGWWLFGNRCLLTVWEARLRGKEPEPVPAAPDEDAPNFIRDGMTRLLGRRPPERWLSYATYGVLWGSFTIAAARLGFGS